MLREILEQGLRSTEGEDRTVKVLLVEDDARVAAALSDVLRLHGVSVEAAGDAAGCFAALERTDRTGETVDAVVLDLGLPDKDGFEVCARLRRERDLPILIATARGDLSSRVHGLHLGADDYLVKPYDVRELLARLHAVRRRAVAAGTRPVEAAEPRIGCGDLVIDVAARTVERAGAPVPLSRKEFDVLALLARNPGVVVRREQLLGEIWQIRDGGGGRTLEVHVASVRAKTSPRLIETVRGVGYRLRRD